MCKYGSTFNSPKFSPIISINKILVTQFMTVKFSQNLNLMQNNVNTATF